MQFVFTVEGKRRGMSDGMHALPPYSRTNNVCIK